MKQIFKLFLSTIFLANCFHALSQKNLANGGSSSFSSANPFFSASKLEYQAPAFDKIKDSDFKPALEEGMNIHLQEIQKIANNPAPPTFENTLVAMEKSGRLLDRVNNVFNVLTGANTNPALQKMQEDVAPKLAAHQDAIYLNSKLFKRVQTIYNNKAKLKLDAESKHLYFTLHKNVQCLYQRIET